MVEFLKGSVLAYLEHNVEQTVEIEAEEGLHHLNVLSEEEETSDQDASVPDLADDVEH